MRILVLLSGGIDSTVVLGSLIGEHNCWALGIDYGQKHLIELEHARVIADHYRVPFRIHTIPVIPLENDVVFAGRNLILAAHAISLAKSWGLEAIAVGCNQSDWMRFPDCRPVFWSHLRDTAEVYNIKVLTPLLYHWKADIIQYAREKGIPIERTWSCYAPQDDIACGKCLACTTRKEAEECLARAS